MAIQTIGLMNQTLDQHSMRDWSKSAVIGPNQDGTRIEKWSPPMIDVDANQMVPSAPQESFAQILAKSVGEVNELQTEANKAIEKLVTGESKNLHETLLAVEKADIAFKAMNQIRLKVLDAYKEIMRMQA